MQFVYTPELREYMQRTGKKNIVIEVVSCNADIDCTELHIHFATEKDVAYYKENRYSVRETELGLLLFPPYKLEYEETLEYGLKKKLWFYSVTCKGVKL